MLLVEHKDRVAWLTINRPEVHNALNAELGRQLAEALTRAGADADVRVVVLRSAGDRVFISGADVGEFRERLATAEGALAYDEEAEALMAAIKAVPKPVVAAIQGYALGSGLLVAMACDLRIAAEGARFGIPVARFSLVPPVPDVARLVQIVGHARAKWLLMTAERIDAATALAFGLVNRVVPAAELGTAVCEVAATLAANAPLSLKSAKQIVDAFGANGQSVRQGEPWYRAAYPSRDFDEGLDAFFAKRPPKFEGR